MSKHKPERGNTTNARDERDRDDERQRRDSASETNEPGTIRAYAVFAIPGREPLLEVEIDAPNRADRTQRAASELHKQRGVALLEDLGFTVHSVHDSMISFSGRRSQLETAFDVRIRPTEVNGRVRHQVDLLSGGGRTLRGGQIPMFDPDHAQTFEAVVLSEPVEFFSTLPWPPPKSYWHLTVPEDVALLTGAPVAHRRRYTGKGIRVAMVDTGFYRHPFYFDRGYDVKPTVLGAGTANPEDDESGHGTGEAANIFAVAPDIELTPVKMSGHHMVAAFRAAMELQPPPQVISCSWGWSMEFADQLQAEQLLALAAVEEAVAAGIVVVFSAGNGHYGFPGQAGCVISAGGVYVSEAGVEQASDYASGFESKIFPGRVVPDVCGLVGMLPKAAYIMLPVQPGDELDQSLAGGHFPQHDETADNDGWAAFSGTSAAAPQIAGACALILQANPSATPAQVKDYLQRTAIDIGLGHASPSTGGNPAIPGEPDLATGYGLIQTTRAVLVASLAASGAGRVASPRVDREVKLTLRESELRVLESRLPGPEV